MAKKKSGKRKVSKKKVAKRKAAKGKVTTRKAAVERSATGTTRKKRRTKKRASKRSTKVTRSVGSVPPPSLAGKFPENSGFVLSDEQVETALVTGEHAGLLEDYLGPEKYRELSALARQANSRSVRGGPRVLILPGIMGSKLGIPRKGWLDDVLWLDPLDVARGELKKLAFKGNADKIRPLGVLLFSYLKLKLCLRIDGFDADFHAYDWRQGVAALGRELARRIKSERGPVSLVAHSMGGLVSRAALTDSALDADVVPRLVMLGTPNAGSFVPVQALRGIYGVVRKIAALDLSHGSDELATKVFSTFPGLYQMLPAPSAFSAVDLYDAGSWPQMGPRPRADLLAEAKHAQDELAPPDDRFRLIAGVNQETITGLSFDGTEFQYELSSAGDGTLPLAFAELPNVPTWYVDESHGSLPNNGRVADTVADLLESGVSNELSQSWSPVRRGITRKVAESDPVPDPFDGRRGPELSQNEVRHIVEELAAPDVREAPVRPVASAVGATTAFQGVVVGRRGQHRLDICLSRDSITDADSRAYVLGIFHDVAPSGAANAIDQRLNGAVREFTARRMFSGNAGEVFDMPAGRQTLYADHVLFVGLGRFDQLDDEVLQLAAESAMRTLVMTKVEEFATVLFGTGSGWTAARSLNDLLTGFLRALLDADDDHRFRSITFCETDTKRYEELRAELYRLAGTTLFDRIEVTISELPPRPPSRMEPMPVQRRAAAGPEPVYLIVRDEGPGAMAAKNGTTILRASLLEATGKAAVLSEEHSVSTAALDGHLKKIEKSGFTLDSLDDFGEQLADLVLHERIAAALHASAGHPLVLVHDAPASRIPWETLCIRGRFPASEGGLSRRYMAEDMSIAKWMEERRNDDVLRLLLVVNPTEDLDGAEEEGSRVRSLFAGHGFVRIDELRGKHATRDTLLTRFKSGDYDAVHYAGHAFFDPQRPQQSGLLCAGHKVLSGSDLARLSRLPSLVFFNACEAARVRGGRSAKKASAKDKAADVALRLKTTAGLAEAFLRGGVANYVGTYWPVGDAPAKAFAETFYTSLLAGTPIGPALQAGREKVRELGSVDWADYIHYGSHDFQLKAKSPPASSLAAPSSNGASKPPAKPTKKSSKTARKKAARRARVTQRA